MLLYFKLQSHEKRSFRSEGNSKYLMHNNTFVRRKNKKRCQDVQREQSGVLDTSAKLFDKLESFKRNGSVRIISKAQISVIPLTRLIGN